MVRRAGIRAGDVLVAPPVDTLVDSRGDTDWTPTLALEVVWERDLRTANVLRGEGVSKRVVEAGRTRPGVLAWGKSLALV